MKDQQRRQITKEFFGLRAKTYNYLKGNNDEDKKAKGTQQCDKKGKLKFQDYKNCLEVAQIENKMNHYKKIKLM